MGLFLLQAWGDKDTMIIEEISSEHKFNAKLVAKHYKIMLDNIAKEQNEIKN